MLDDDAERTSPRASAPAVRSRHDAEQRARDIEPLMAAADAAARTMSTRLQKNHFRDTVLQALAGKLK